MIQLRPYQINALKSLRNGMAKGLKRFILCAPTGSGKTIMFSYMVKNAVDKGKKVLIVTDRIELIQQTGGALDNFGLKPIEIKAGKKLKSLNGILYTAMAQTLIRRIRKSEYIKWIQSLDLIIFDEAHKQAFNFLMPHIDEKTYVIGATATPFRDSKQDSLDEFYQEIVEVCSISELIQLGYLSNPVSYGVSVDLSGVKTKGGEYDEKSMGDKYTEIELYHGVYDNYMRITPGKKAIIFAPNVEASQVLVNDFKAKGLPIEHLDGTTPKKRRREILEWFDQNPNAIISNVGILNAGFDCPSVEVVILYRATKSLPLFLQMCGRGSRISPGKDSFTILDFGNNIKRHGFWQEDRVWKLSRPKKKEGESPVKECPECCFILPAPVMKCSECGHQFEKTEKEEQDQIIAELKMLTYQQIKNEIKTADFKKLHDIAMAKGYKKQWIYHQLKTHKDLERYAEFMGYNKKWVDYQLEMRQK